MKKTSILLVLAALSLLAVSSVSAFVLLSPPRTWDSAPTYVVDNRGLASITDSDGGVAATVNAIRSNQAWNGAGAGTVINAQAGSVANWQLGDGVPMLNFSDPEHVCNGNCLAATFTGFFSGGTIFDADIVTNNSHSWTSMGEDPGGSGCSGEFYIEGVMVHEAGHGLGIGHTNVGGATMFPSVSSCNNGPASTAADDEAAINDLYGGGGGGIPANSCQGRCGQQAPAGCWCDFACQFYGDCCPNKFQQCG